MTPTTAPGDQPPAPAEADPFAHLADRTPLHDEHGQLVLVFSLASGTRDGRPWADVAWRPPSVRVDLASDLALHALAGHAISTSDKHLVDALTSAGATELRHAHTMSHPLLVVPEAHPGSGVAVEPLSASQLQRHGQRLAELSYAAYRVGHPDHAHDTVAAVVEELRAIGRGELLGGYLDRLSRVAFVDGDIVGACLLVDRDEAPPPDGGPWVIDIFRDPASQVRGIGTALLTDVVAAARLEAAPGVSLVVSHANDHARRLYRALGFEDADASWTLAL